MDDRKRRARLRLAGDSVLALAIFWFALPYIPLRGVLRPIGQPPWEDAILMALVAIGFVMIGASRRTKITQPATTERVAENPNRKRQGPLLWLGGRSRRPMVVAAVAIVLTILYPLAYGPWLWIRSGWYRDAQGRVSFEHPIWEPLYLFNWYIAPPLPEPYWHNYQRFWIQRPKQFHPRPVKPQAP